MTPLQILQENHSVMSIAQIAKEVKRDYSYIQNLAVRHNIECLKFQKQRIDYSAIDNFITANYKTMKNNKMAAALEVDVYVINSRKRHLGLTSKQFHNYSSSAQTILFDTDKYCVITGFTLK